MNLKEIVCRIIDEHQDELIGIAKEIYANPELGYKEFNTANLIKDQWKKLKQDYQSDLAVTGVKARVKGRKSRLNVCIIGEMDAVVCPLHPFADPMTGAAHACGHHTQIASMIGCSIGLIKGNLMNALDGDVTFLAVPAEEFIELEYRERLKKEGRITFFGGKQELIKLGAFDDVDIAMMTHSQTNAKGSKIFAGGSSLGFVGKTITFTGKEAHAGGAPHEGINALNAAMASILCIHAQRETFQDKDSVRVHPIITKGGDLVNIVPADVHMETYVRAKNLNAVMDACVKVDRAITGAAYAIGAQSEIRNIPGYMPLQQDDHLDQIFRANVITLMGKDNLVEGVDLTGSTDMGDLGQILPVIHPLVSGFQGSVHSKDFMVNDWYTAVILPAKLMAMTVIDLLEQDCEKGLAVKNSFTPTFNKLTYEAYWNQLIH